MHSQTGLEIFVSVEGEQLTDESQQNSVQGHPLAAFLPNLTKNIIRLENNQTICPNMIQLFSDQKALPIKWYNLWEGSTIGLIWQRWVSLCIKRKNKESNISVWSLDTTLVFESFLLKYVLKTPALTFEDSLVKVVDKENCLTLWLKSENVPQHHHTVF